MKAIGYARDHRNLKVATRLKAQAASRATAEVQGAQLVDVVVDDGESAKN